MWKIAATGRRQTVAFAGGQLAANSKQTDGTATRRESETLPLGGVNLLALFDFRATTARARQVAKVSGAVVIVFLFSSNGKLSPLAGRRREAHMTALLEFIIALSASRTQTIIWRSRGNERPMQTGTQQRRQQLPLIGRWRTRYLFRAFLLLGATKLPLVDARFRAAAAGDLCRRQFVLRAGSALTAAQLWSATN